MPLQNFLVFKAVARPKIQCGRSGLFLSSMASTVLLIFGSLNSGNLAQAAVHINQASGGLAVPVALSKVRKPATEESQPDELNPLVFELQLDNSRLSDSFSAYEVDQEVLLPVGELARLLTLGVTVDPSTRIASGFLLQENRSFRLDFDKAEVILPGQTSTEQVDASLIRWIDDDLYVASSLLQRWWPVDFNVSFSALTMKVIPREQLPIQARLERERSLGKKQGRGSDRLDLNYPLLDTDYQFFSAPFVDQTLGFQSSRNSAGKNTFDASYSALLTGDLLGMEASFYVSSTKSKSETETRFTLERYDPEPNMLGPLGARSLRLGHVSTPALNNVIRSGTGGSRGFLISNKPLTQSSSFGVHKPQGELQPGWDVTLYFNDALIGLRQSRSDGLFEFEEQQLVFGRNEFRLVFNGPLGQTRVERQVFVLDRTLTRPGEVHYTVAAQRSDDGSKRQIAQFDVGLAEMFSVTAGLSGFEQKRSTTGNSTGQLSTGYANVGLRSSVAGFLLNADIARSEDDGHLSELGLRTSVAGYSIEATRIRLRDFLSEYFSQSGDPLSSRDRLRLNGSLAWQGQGLRVPLTLDVSREKTLQGRETLNLQTRQSLNLTGTNLSHLLSWQSTSGVKSTSGSIQVSRRVAGIGLNSQLAYTFKPKSELVSLALTGDKFLAQNTRVNLGLVRTFTSNQTSITAGYTRNLGSFGWSLTGRYGSKGDRAVGVQFFMAMGRDARKGRWVNDWQPLASAGAVSARAFLDANMNGTWDADEQPLKGVGFLMNGNGRPAARTDESGLALLTRLSPRAYTDLALDSGTLEEPQWEPSVEGFRVLPRPGKVYQMDFPVVTTGEVDGTVSLREGGKTRLIGNAELELVNTQGVVVNSVRSSSDGYYLFDRIRPGKYQLRVNPGQVERLKLEPLVPLHVTILGDGEILSGQDILLIKRP